MVKISVLLATNRINSKVFPYIEKCKDGLCNLQNNTFTNEFSSLCTSRLLGIAHFIEPTLRSLESQTFKDFELVISHRYEKGLDEIRKVLKWNTFTYPIRLVEEKPSIWHNLGNQYHTVANNKNTSFIHSNGELIYHIDDLTFFNENLLQEAWDNYQNGKYMTGRTFRCITYDKSLKDGIDVLGPNKTRYTKSGWTGQHKPLSDSKEIPMSAFWTCSASVSANDLLKINGYDELYDGSLTGIDMEAGTRLEKVSKYKRVASNTYLYEIDDPTPKNNIRDDVMMRNLWHIDYITANSWKPKLYQLKRYERWHKINKGELDSNWNKFMDVPLYKLERKE